jgi:uncharacterized protein (TIGR03437 family)
LAYSIIHYAPASGRGRRVERFDTMETSARLSRSHRTRNEDAARCVSHRFMLRLRLVFALAATALAASAQQYTISTVSGTAGTSGYAGDGGPASAAQLNNPTAMARDAQGNIYISDLDNYVVREIDTNGNIRSVAGNGTFGFSGDGGPATSGQLASVDGIAVDAKGNVYLADALNSRVRVVTADLTISTFAGNGTRGYSGDGGRATDAQLYYPSGVAVDAQGNVYIADYGAGVVRKVAPSGIITTFAGNGGGIFGAALGDGGPATAALLSQPYSMVTDSAGNVFIGDLGSGRIRRVGKDGVISTVATSVQAQNFAIDPSGAIYYSNYNNSTVVKLYPSGTSLWIAGDGQAGYSGDGSSGISAQLNAPYGIAIDNAGNLFVADSKNEVIRELSPAAVSIALAANAASNIGFVNVGSGNAGSAAAAIAPGEIVTLFGAGIGPSTLTLNAPQNGRFGTSLAGVTVSFNGTLAPIVYVSANQVAVQAPYEIDGSGSAYIAIGYNGKTSVGVSVPVVGTAPGIFTLDSTGSGQAAAVNADGTINGAAHPVPLGGIVSIYVTGEGDINPAVADGQISGANPSGPNAGVSVTVGGQTAATAYIGEAPFEIAGLLQINVQIPANITPSAATPVVVDIGGASSQNNVTLTVSAQ